MNQQLSSLSTKLLIKTGVTPSKVANPTSRGIVTFNPWRGAGVPADFCNLKYTIWKVESPEKKSQEIICEVLAPEHHYGTLLEAKVATGACHILEPLIRERKQKSRGVQYSQGGVKGI